jgi:hypothetical protein
MQPNDHIPRYRLNTEVAMPYALFSNDLKISETFASKAEVWQHAAGSGLVMEVSSGEEDPPRRILHSGYAIRAIAPDAASATDRQMAQLVAARAVNPTSATAAS